MAIVDIPRARPLDSYPPLPYRGEDVRAVIRVEECACGSRAEQLAGEGIDAAVRRHNAAVEHILWRAER